MPRSSAGQVPAGVADYFWGEAYERRTLEATLLGVFRTWGYGDVVTPAFEYADTLSARGSHELQSELCRFLDRDGSMLASVSYTHLDVYKRQDASCAPGDCPKRHVR